MTSLFHTTAAGHNLAYRQKFGSLPGVLFCGGFRSDMESTKVGYIADWCEANDVAFTRFDYFAHGKSEGDFENFTIGRAVSDVLEMLDHVVTGPQILIGSSMGAWAAMRAALERKFQVKAFMGIAAAPDFTEKLMFARMTPEQRAELDEEGKLFVPSDYGSDLMITRELIHEGREHLLLDDVIGLDMPITLLHGQQDMDVPWETSLQIAKQVVSDNVTTLFIKDGDHRLNRPTDMQRMTDALKRLLEN